MRCAAASWQHDAPSAGRGCARRARPESEEQLRGATQVATRRAGTTCRRARRSPASPGEARRSRRGAQARRLHAHTYARPRVGGEVPCEPSARERGAVVPYFDSVRAHEPTLARRLDVGLLTTPKRGRDETGGTSEKVTRSPSQRRPPNGRQPAVAPERRSPKLRVRRERRLVVADTSTRSCRSSRTP